MHVFFLIRVAEIHDFWMAFGWFDPMFVLLVSLNWMPEQLNTYSSAIGLELCFVIVGWQHVVVVVVRQAIEM